MCFWNKTVNRWDTNGLQFLYETNNNLYFKTYHLTEFAAMIDSNYHEKVTKIYLNFFFYLKLK